MFGADKGHSIPLPARSMGARLPAAGPLRGCRVDDEPRPPRDPRRRAPALGRGEAMKRGGPRPPHPPQDAAARAPRAASPRAPGRGSRGSWPARGDDARDLERLLFHHISDAVFATDDANRVTYWSASAERLFGYRADEATGRAFGDLLPFEMTDPGGERALLAELAAGHTWRGTGTATLPDGRRIWLESTVEPIVADGRFVGSVSVSRDISATVEAQQGLAAHERFVDAVLDVAGALVVVLDADGRVVRFNRAAERLSGYAAADIVGRAIWDTVVPPDEAAPLRSVLGELQEHAFPNAHEDHWRARDGALRLISWHNTCLTDGEGRVTHVIATGLDITDARRGAEAVRGIESVGRLLAEQGPSQVALDAALRELEARMGYGRLSLYVRDGDGLRLGAQLGYRDIPARLDAATGVIGRVFRTCRAALIPNVSADADYVAGDASVVAELAVPLLGDDGPLGVLNVETETPGALTSTDLDLARAIADRLASALLRNREQQELRERARLFAALSDFTAAANAIHDPERLALALVEAVGDVVPSELAIITTLEPGDGSYRVRASRGLGGDARGATIEPGDGATGRALSERAVIAIDHYPRASYARAVRDHLQCDAIAIIAAPLLRDGAVLGAISVGRAGPAAGFTSAEREVVALLGSQAALALANAQLVEEVSALAIRDGLTGLYNRRHFDAALDDAIARYRRRGPGAGLAAIMFDLDHFGQFNRSHGHLAGDAVLRLFGGILHERLRSADLVARYGGEEFVAILEDCTLLDAARLAEDVRSDLERRSADLEGGTRLRATVSAGCAVIDLGDPTRAALLGRADAGLFTAKRAGRNQVRSG